jgi:hypothetical protein
MNSKRTINHSNKNERVQDLEKNDCLKNLKLLNTT